MSKTIRPRVLGSLTREVDANRVWRKADPSIPVGAWWGVPVWQVQEWITSALMRGDYATASMWSELITPGIRRRPSLAPASTPSRGKATRVQYWIQGDGWWTDSNPREIARFVASGFVPVIKIAPAP